LKGDGSIGEVHWLSLDSEEEPQRGQCRTLANLLKEVALSAWNTLVTSHLTITTQSRQGVSQSIELYHGQEVGVAYPEVMV
jgi:hypothetical protein